MKNFKNVTLLLLTFIIFNCTPAEEAVLKEIDIPSVVFNVDTVIALPAGTDITNQVTFDGQPAASFTTELEINDQLKIEKPGGIPASDSLVYVGGTVYDANGEVVEFEPFNLKGDGVSTDGNLYLIVPSGEPVNYYEDLSGGGIPTIIFEPANQGSADIEYKYDLEIMITRNGTEYGPYKIDPKIKIRRR